MSKVWNINVLLCEKANDDVSTIENIFDKLVINKKIDVEILQLLQF